MMTPLAQKVFDLDVAASALAHGLGRSERAEDIRQKVKALRLAAGRAVLAELAQRPDQIEPANAVRMVIEHALAAGMEWPDIVAAVNTASERRSR